MGKKQDKVEDFLGEAGAFAEGETFVTAAKAMPLGGMAGLSKSSSLYMFGAVGAIAATVRDSRAPSPTELEAKIKKGLYLALTSQRLFLVAIGGLGNAPREIAAILDRSAIQSVEMGTTRVSMIKLPTLTLHLGPEESIAFEFAKPDAKDAEHLYQSMQ